MKVIDFFCGAGGFSLGFKQAGFDCVLGVDIWDKALLSYQHNIGGSILQEDIQKVDIDLIKSYKPDVIIGSPPCQKFSTANRHTKTKDDSLIVRFMEIVNEVQPKYWVWENVLGSSSVMQGVHLDAQNLGVAQRRRRNFVANFDLTPLLNHTTTKKTVRQILGSQCSKYQGILDGYNSTIYSLDDVSPTIRRIPLKWYDGRQMQKPFRFTGIPMLDIKDHLQLMSFPDTYQIYGGKTDAMIQIGNAVCPKVALEIANLIR